MLNNSTKEKLMKKAAAKSERLYGKSKHRGGTGKGTAKPIKDEYDSFQSKPHESHHHHHRHYHYPKRTSPKLKKATKVITIIAAVLVGIILVCAIAAAILFGRAKHVKMNQTDEELGITEDDQRDKDSKYSSEMINNILFLGIDTKDMEVTQGRSDCMMVCTLDKTHKKIKFTSILRDSKVPIPGLSSQKINAAYAYGKAPLALKTVNSNFGLNIRDYVTIDFAGLIEIVDFVGGVTIDLTETEAWALSTASEPLSAGINRLDGKQALSFTRLRSIDTDYYRANRQQMVLSCLFNMLKDLSTQDKLTFIYKFLDCVETSLSMPDIVALCSVVVSDYEVVKNIVPDPDYDKDVWGGIDETGQWVWKFDLEAARARIREIIYEFEADAK